MQTSWPVPHSPEQCPQPTRCSGHIVQAADEGGKTAYDLAWFPTCKQREAPSTSASKALRTGPLGSDLIRDLVAGKREPASLWQILKFFPHMYTCSKTSQQQCYHDDETILTMRATTATTTALATRATAASHHHQPPPPALTTTTAATTTTTTRIEQKHEPHSNNNFLLSSLLPDCRQHRPVCCSEGGGVLFLFPRFVSSTGLETTPGAPYVVPRGAVVPVLFCCCSPRSLSVHE